MNPNADFLEQAVGLQSAGQLDDARRLLQEAIRTHPGDNRPHRMLGVMEMEAGNLPGAIQHLSNALRIAHNDAGTVSDLAQALSRAGLFDQAAGIMEQFLERVGERPDIRYGVAIVRFRQQQIENARAELDRVLALQPDHQGALLHMARIDLGNEDNKAAAVWLERCLDANAENWDALVLLARIRENELDFDSARELLQRAVAIPGLTRPDAHIRLSRLLEDGGEPDAALTIAEQATEQCSGHDLAWRHHGDLLKRMGRIDEAIACFERAHEVLRTAGSGFGLDRPELRRTNRAKLRHDIEQLRYLKDRGSEVPGLDSLIAEHENLLAGLPENLSPGDTVGLHPMRVLQAGGHYNRCMTRAEAPELETAALNPDLDAAAIEADYREREPGITWIDDFLRPEAVESLRRYLLESTIWYDAAHPNGYVGAYMHDGFTCPLIFQIARELPALLPGIFGNRPLLQLWAYHYDSELAGIGMHADFAAVNVNFWVTPDDAMLDPDSGGMVVWDKEAPLEWTVQDYNTDDPETKKTIDDFLEAEGAQQIRIPHRQNRVVIFNSDLFHKTDDILFKPGFENRRINVTMLYGQRDRG